MIDFNLILQSIPNLLQGTLVSLQITLVAAILGLFIGILFGAIETTQQRILKFLIGCYVTLFRGTPMLVQILFVYYVLPQFGVTIPPFWAAGIAIGLNSGAYMSQVIKSGIQAVPIGQIEAAKTLGLSKFDTYHNIILPQAFRIVLPALGNELITLVKDSSLASIIGVMELSKEASIIRSRTYDAFSILLAISMIYLTLTATISTALKILEKKLRIHA